MIIIKAGGHPTGHRSCMQSSCSGISGFFPYQGPATQVFPHHRTHPVGFLRLCLSDETQRLEQSFEGTGPGVCAGGSTSLTEASATHSQENNDLSPSLPLPQLRKGKQKNRASFPPEAAMSAVIVSTNCVATPDRSLGFVSGFHFLKSILRLLNRVLMYTIHLSSFFIYLLIYF